MWRSTSSRTSPTVTPPYHTCSVDHHRDSAGALIETPGGIGPHAALETDLVQALLELVAHCLGALLLATPLGIAGRALVGADEDVTLEVGHVATDPTIPATVVRTVSRRY